VLDTALALHAAGCAFALAIVVEADGSTYRKPGAMALVGDDGQRVGVISGGCLEAGLDKLGRDALEADAPRMNVFDTRSDDDLIFGSGSGCRGRMHVVAIPVRPGRPAPVFDRLAAAWATHADATIALAELAPDLFTTGQVEIRSPTRLLAIGAGPEMPPLLRVARTLGWYTSVADHRDGLLERERVRDADLVTRGRPGRALRELAGQRIHAAIVMTHLADADLEALAALAQSAVPYVGLLGPLARRDELLARLGESHREALRGRLHAPVGLRLGGEGPEAIALSIAAELQQEFQNRR
jgi:xanthine dehydrogenase accessory factor